VKSSPWLHFFLRIFVGFFFAYAGFSKLMEPIENFRGVIAQYQVLPYALVPYVAEVMPWLEFIFGVFMLLGFSVPWTSAALAFLCLGFLIVIGSSNMLLEAGGKDCGCFGQGGPIHLTVRQVFGLDLVNLFIALRLFYVKKTPLSLDQLIEESGRGRD
jgi:uncharacterized membrane protein YphA (DoxX/SURF4 family)